MVAIDFHSMEKYYGCQWLLSTWEWLKLDRIKIFNLKIQYSHPLHNLQIPVSQSGTFAGSRKMLRKRCLILFPPSHVQSVITRNICFELWLYISNLFCAFSVSLFQKIFCVLRELLVFYTLLLGGLTSEKLAGSSQMRNQHQMLSSRVKAHGKMIDMKCKDVCPLKCTDINVHIFATCMSQEEVVLQMLIRALILSVSEILLSFILFSQCEKGNVDV